MARYLYKKYTTKRVYVMGVLMHNYTIDHKDPLTGFSSYSLNRSNGIFTVSGPLTLLPGVSGAVYSASGELLLMKRWKSTTQIDYYSGKSYPDIIKGDYVGDVIAEDGTYSNDGEKDGYWYVKINQVFPTMKTNINGIWRECIDGWVNVNGVWKSIERILIKENGVWKEGAISCKYLFMIIVWMEAIM